MPSQGTEAAAGDAVTRVCAIALSGGVDSSYAAHLLRDRFETLVGVSHAIWKDSRCCNVETIAKARGLCAEIGIPYFLIDMEEDFRRLVVDDFIETYGNGRTPNPCVRCNERLRFTIFHRAVRDLLESEGILSVGEEFTFSTGHYARTAWVDGRVALLRGIDLDKDQSYMLYRVPQRILERTVFPLGTMRKRDVLREFGQGGLRLPVAPPSGGGALRAETAPDPAAAGEMAAATGGPAVRTTSGAAALTTPAVVVEESQEACFVDTDYPDFLSRYLPRDRGFTPGDIVDSGGAVIGTHRGFIHYTIGQRKGLGLGSGPWFVLRIEPETNCVVVGRKEELGKSSFFGEEPVWFIEPEAQMSCTVQVRYRARDVKGIVMPLRDGRVRVELAEPATISPGQAAGFYRGDRVIGGAVIAG